MLRDEITIELAAGKGGDGLMSFSRERYKPKGGPDGGDGGRGGSVFLRAAPGLHSLLKLGRRTRYRARNGVPGGPSCCTGRTGEDLILEVPVGTQVFDAERGNLLRDLSEPEQLLEVARGGAGGRGNTSFASAVRQAPRLATDGKPGETLRVRLELKLLADVGLVGLPNAGKSTFLASVTAAQPKIADYEFTTLSPQVGIAEVGDYDTLCLADLPGLIEGAAEGHGLGHRFLRHVERCGVLLHLVDVEEGARVEPLEAFRIVERELEKSSPELSAKPRIVVATKCESAAAGERADALELALRMPVLRVSSLRREGLQPVLRRARELVREPP